MSRKAKASVLFIILVSIVTGLIGFNDNKQNALPKGPFTLIEPDVLYTISPRNSDAPSLTDQGIVEGVQQEYRIHLRKGKSYYTDMSVGWRDEVYIALFEDNSLLGEAWCGWQARCHFTVDAEHDIQATLKIRSTGIENTPFTIAIYDATNRGIFSRFTPKRSADISVAPMPVIEQDGIYSGTFYASNSPLFWDGTGNLNDYRLTLNQNDTVMVKATSSGPDIGVSLYDGVKRLASGFKQDDDPDACFKIKVLATGQYVVRIWTKDLQNKKSQDFIFELAQGSNAQSQQCNN